MQPDEMKRTFVEQGLVDVTETQLMIRMDYQSFDDYWAPIAAGEGPLGKYAAVRDAYEAGQPDGPRSFATSPGPAAVSFPDLRPAERGELPRFWRRNNSPGRATLRPGFRRWERGRPLPIAKPADRAKSPPICSARLMRTYFVSTTALSDPL
jgi:hypothetical protein